MSSKPEQIASSAERSETGQYDARYLAFFDCFNRQHFYEAHEALEGLWLPIRQESDGLFYKGLIQLAGAFVHIRKERPGPAVALLSLAQSNLKRYPNLHCGLDIGQVVSLIERWLRELNSPNLCPTSPWHHEWPILKLGNTS